MKIRRPAHEVCVTDLILESGDRRPELSAKVFELLLCSLEYIKKEYKEKDDVQTHHTFFLAMRLSGILFAIQLVSCLHFTAFCTDNGDKEQTSGSIDYHLVKFSRARNNYDKASGVGFTEGEKHYQAKIDKNVDSIHDIRDQKKLPGTKNLAYIDQKDKDKQERRKLKSKSKKRKIMSSSTGSL